jgi:hypothetical protein
MTRKDNISAPLMPLSNLLFRRQFLLGPLEFKPSELWNCRILHHGLVLSTHQDLIVSSELQGNHSVTIVGFAVDPLFPYKTLSEITKSISSAVNNIDEIIHLTHSLTGRWVIIYQDEKETYLLTDPCGFRSVFYYSDDRRVWCGSQPEIIKAATLLQLSADKILVDFLMKQHLVGSESIWIGNKTIYENCFRLMPNHYLNLNRLQQVRFFPVDIKTTSNISLIVERATQILQGTYEAIFTRHNSFIQALTGGLDSRVLLAASRRYSQNIQYFVDREGVLPENHPDIWVPKRLARKLNIDFEVKNSKIDPPGWFISLLANNITGLRVLTKTRSIYAYFLYRETRMNLNGNAGEICRDCPYSPFAAEHIYTTKELLKLILYGKYPITIPFLENEIQDWRKNLYTRGGERISIQNLIYWEQRLGTWGAQYPAEQEIAIEQISPFNCRMLIETLLAAPQQLRNRPEYLLHKQLIRAMWPETLSVPINPGKYSIRFMIKKQIRNFILKPVINQFTNKP